MSTESHRKDSIQRSITDSFSIVLRPVAIVRGDDSESDTDEYVYATDLPDLPDNHRASKQLEDSKTVHFQLQDSVSNGKRRNVQDCRCLLAQVLVLSSWLPLTFNTHH